MSVLTNAVIVRQNAGRSGDVYEVICSGSSEKEPADVYCFKTSEGALSFADALSEMLGCSIVKSF